MKILLWLAVPLAITVIAMAWSLWVGRANRADGDGHRPGRPGKADAAYDRFSAAVQKPVPRQARSIAAQQRERPSGIAVRPSQRRSR